MSRRFLPSATAMNLLKVLCVALTLASLGSRRPSAGDPTLLWHHSCRGKEILRVPLTSKQESFVARTASEFTVVVLRDGGGWVAQVFAPADSKHSDNLLTPAHDWSGMLASEIQPQLPPAFYPNTRTITVRSTKHLICLSLAGAKLAISKARVSGELSSATFESGTLVVRWRENGDG
jgi:hypothetical protein